MRINSHRQSGTNRLCHNRPVHKHSERTSLMDEENRDRRSLDNGPK